MNEFGGRSVEISTGVPPIWEIPPILQEFSSAPAEITAPPVEITDTSPCIAPTDALAAPSVLWIHDRAPEASVVPHAVNEVATTEQPVTVIRGRNAAGRKLDIVQNNRHSEPELAVAAAAALTEGLPEHWVRVTAGDPGRYYYADDLWEPRFFAKARDSNLPTYSILKEISLAPEVRTAVNSDSVQTIARGLGYVSMHYIEPLAAISEHRTGRKIVVYPYQSGIDTHHISRMEHPLQRDKDGLREIAYCLRTMLHARGIEARDLTNRQLIVEEQPAGRRLHLVDTEHYRRTPSGK